MSTSESRSAVVLELAEEFLERYRKGERPAIKDYTDRNPELAGEIREVFPAMAMMENIAIRDDSLAGEATDATCGVEATGSLLPEQLGDYRIIREIGHGGMGVVYEAEQVSLGRHVALKVLPPQMVRDRKQQQRFEREARAAAKLHHTNIVPVFGVGEHKGNAYYVMQYIQGQSLDAVIEELERMRSGGLESHAAGVAEPGDTQPHDATAADVARSLLTGRFEAAKANGSTQNLGLASPGDLRLSPGSAGSPPGESIAATVADVATTAESSPQVIARAAIPRTAPGDSSAHALSSLSLPRASRDSRSKRSRSATYWQSVAQIGFQVADALDYAHKQGILHRDIKPSNLLLDSHGTVWVTDFGLAKADDQQNLTHTGDILGTIRYMPPEAFEGKYDARGDVYSLGLTLYELLALRPAFDQKDRGILIRQVTHEDPPRLSKVRVDIPRDLETIVHKAIDRDPSHRYSSADLLAADFQRFLEDEPIQARRLSSIERVNRWRRRNRGLAVALGVTALTLILGTVFSTVMAIRANRYAERAERFAGEATRAAAEARKSAASEAAAARSARAESARQAAARGLALVDQKDSARGMLWLVRAMELDPEDASGIHHAARVNLLQSAREQLAVPRLVLQPAGLEAVEPGKASKEWVQKVAFSPDGQTLATAHASGLVRLWNMEDGRERVRPLEHKGSIRALAFSPDGRQVWVGVWARKSQLSTWDVGSGRQVGAAVDFPGVISAFRPDGQAIAVHFGSNALRVFDRVTGKPLGPMLVDPRHRSNFSPIAFSPDGRSLASGESNDSEYGVSRAALAWDVENGKQRFETGKHNGYHIYAIAWSPDGKTVATGGHDCTLRFWDTTTGALKGLPRVMSSQVAELQYSPDGRTIAVVAATRTNDDHARASVRLLDSRTGGQVGPEWAYETGVWCLAFSPDGSAVAVGQSDGSTEVRALPEANPLGKPVDLLASYGGLDATDDGRIAVGTGSGEVFMSDPATGNFSVFPTAAARGNWGVVFARDGKTLAIGTGYSHSTSYGPPDAEVWIYDVGRRERTCPPIRVGEATARPYRFNKDGTIVYTKSEDRKTVRLWDATTGKTLGRDIAGGLDTTDTAVSLDDLVVLQSDRQGRITRRQVEGGKLLGEPWLIQPQGIRSIVVNPDGHTFLTIAVDATVRLWDIESGQPLGPPIEQDSTCRAAVMSPDGRTLATATMDGMLRFWDAPTALPLGPSPSASADSIQKLGFLPRGDRLAVAKDSSLYLIPVPGEIAGEVAQVRRWAEARAGWAIDAAGTVARVSTAEWTRRRQQLSGELETQTLLGSRKASEGDRHLAIALSSVTQDDHAAVWHLDRVLAGGSDVPALWLQRAFAHTRLGHTGLALADLERSLALDPRRPAEWGVLFTVMRDLPENDLVKDFESRALSRWLVTTRKVSDAADPVLTELAARRGACQAWGQAAALLRTASLDNQGHYPDYDSMGGKYVICLLRKGDLAAFRAFMGPRFARVVAGELKVFTLDFLSECLLAPDAVGDPDALVRLAETFLNKSPEGPLKAQFMRACGYAMYRAGRFDDCIARIEESIRLRGGQSQARDWAFLAMAHERKGNHAEATSWLNRIPTFKLPDFPEKFWEEQRMKIHGGEAEAVVRYDPIFPRDPFAH